MKQKHSLDFGKKENVFNYACQTYQQIFMAMKFLHVRASISIENKVTSKHEYAVGVSYQ